MRSARLWNLINITSLEFDKLNRMIPNLIKQNDGKVPKLYVKTIADLETLVQEATEKQKVTPKKMNATNQRSFNAIKQRIRRNNRDFERDINQYREDKDAFMQEDVIEDTAATAAKKPKKALLPDQTLTGASDEGFTMVGAGGKAMVYTPESILKHLRTIVEARGRKNTDRLEQIRIMERLLDVAANDYQKIRVLLTLIPTRFDISSGTGTAMSQEQWKL